MSIIRLQFLPYALRRLLGGRKRSQSRAAAPMDPDLLYIGNRISRIAGVQIPEIFWLRVYQHCVLYGPIAGDPHILAAITNETGETSAKEVDAWSMILAKIKAKPRDAWSIDQKGYLRHALLDDFADKCQKNQEKAICAGRRRWAKTEAKEACAEMPQALPPVEKAVEMPVEIDPLSRARYKYLKTGNTNTGMEGTESPETCPYPSPSPPEPPLPPFQGTVARPSSGDDGNPLWHHRRFKSRATKMAEGLERCVAERDGRYWEFKAMFRDYVPQSSMHGCDREDVIALQDYLSDRPRITLEQFRDCLGNFHQSEGANPCAPPKYVLPRLDRYASGPLNRFGDLIATIRPPADREENPSRESAQRWVGNHAWAWKKYLRELALIREASPCCPYGEDREEWLMRRVQLAARRADIPVQIAMVMCGGEQ